jgi:hypothetical protein
MNDSLAERLVQPALPTHAIESPDAHDYTGQIVGAVRIPLDPKDATGKKTGVYKQ